MTISSTTKTHSRFVPGPRSELQVDVSISEKSTISAYADTRHPRGGMSSTPPGRRVENESEMSLEQKLRPRGLAEWTAVLAAAGLGVSVPLHVFDATVLFTYHPSAMALSFGALMPLGVYVALKTRALGAGPLRLRAMWTHAALQTLAAALAFGGLVAIYLNKSVLETALRDDARSPARRRRRPHRALDASRRAELQQAGLAAVRTRQAPRRGEERAQKMRRLGGSRRRGVRRHRRQSPGGGGGGGRASRAAWLLLLAAGSPDWLASRLERARAGASAISEAEARRRARWRWGNERRRDVRSVGYTRPISRSSYVYVHIKDFNKTFFVVCPVRASRARYRRRDWKKHRNTDTLTPSSWR